MADEKFHSPSEELHRLAYKAREQARWNRTRKNTYTLFGFVAGVAAGLGTTIGLVQNGIVPAGWIKVGFLGGAVVGVCLAMFSWSGARKKARCPSCAHDWEVDEENQQNSLTWHYCPGCALSIPRSLQREGSE